MIKGALFDIDDTLFSHEIHAVPKATLRALDKLRDKGIKIGICTSRVAAEIPDIPDELLDRIDCKIVGTGATTVVENEYFKSYAIPLEDARKYTRFFEENGISYDYSDVNGDLYYWGDLEKVNNGKYLRMAKGNVKFKAYEDEEITNLFYFDAPEEKIGDIDAIMVGPHLADYFQTVKDYYGEECLVILMEKAYYGKLDGDKAIDHLLEEMDKLHDKGAND